MKGAGRLRYAYYPGCAAKGSCPELHRSTAAVAGRLGIELVELKDAACCGAGVIHEADPDLQLALNARTFAQAERMGLDILTVCGTCTGVMAGDNKELREDPSLLSRINRMLAKEGVEYKGGTRVNHLLWVLIRDLGLDRLRGYVVRPLEGLKVAPFYGCNLLRPSKVLGFDDPDHPDSLERVVNALGGKPVEYEGKTRCCGFPIILEKEGIALSMIGKHETEAKEKGADCMVTPCPLCHMALDVYQGKAGRKAGRALNIPVFHLSQIVGLAIGLEPDELGLERHLVSAGELLSTGRLRQRRLPQPK